MGSKEEAEKFAVTAKNSNAQLKVSKIWNSFCDVIRYDNRFFIENDMKKYLDDLCQINQIIEQDSTFFRARILSPETYGELEIRNDVNGKKNILGLPEDKMKSPPKGISSAGRANPKGISYLYLASNPQTACSEVRPISTDLISVIKFKINRDIKVINLKCIEKEDKEKALIHFIEKVMMAFILPIRGQNDIEYAPTQLIASYFKSKGYDGIKYGTFNDSNEDSYNLVLFDESICTVSNDNSSDHGDIYRVIYKEMRFQNLTRNIEVSISNKIGNELLREDEIQKIAVNLELYYKQSEINKR